MRINTNITALNTFNSYTSANNKISGSVAKLSSGYAINNAADNAAGLAISEKMRAQVRGLDRASANSQDAISLIQTAEGNLKSSDEILQRMREIAVQSSSDVNENAIDREALQAEFSQLQSELDEIAEDASFNNQKLLNGNLASSKTDTKVSTTAAGLTATAGKANDGIYSFKVSVKETAAAVLGEEATVAKSTITNSTVNSTYFDGAAAAIANVSTAKSSLLNGNYKLEGATVGEDGTISVTAKGDNGQVFTAKLTAADYKGAATPAAKTYTLNFGSDAFSLTFGVSTDLGVAPTASAVSDLAKAFEGTEFTIAGGVDAKEAEKGVYASLTGTADVKLEAGMDSIAFDNGVTVNFDKLTSANLDTSGTAYESVFGTGGTSTITVSSKENDGLTIQVGANTGDEMEINLERADAEYLGVKGLNVGSQDGASKAIDVVNKAINQVTSQRAYLGAMQNRLDYKIANLETSSQNLTSAESAIRDVDMAAEMTKFTNANILSQASTAMLAQANTLPQNVLSLLG